MSRTNTVQFFSVLLGIEPLSSKDISHLGKEKSRHSPPPPSFTPSNGHMASEEGRVNFLATGDSVLPAGAAQPMALGGGDVMRLPRLLLGTGQRILLEAQAAELLRLGGAGRGRGKGRQAEHHRAAAAYPLSPLPLCLPTGGPWGPPHTRTRKTEQSGSTRGGWDSHTQLEKTDIQPTIGTQGTGELG